MSEQTFSMEDLKRILLAGAGAEEGVDLDGDTILDQRFDELGYESLALLETGGRIEREYGIALDDEALADAATPRQLITVVNEHIAAAKNVAA